jgi:hypothetical protein
MVCAPLATAQEWPLGGPSTQCPATGKLEAERRPLLLKQTTGPRLGRGFSFLSRPSLRPLPVNICRQQDRRAYGLDFYGAAGRGPGMREGFCVLESQGRCPGGL